MYVLASYKREQSTGYGARRSMLILFSLFSSCALVGTGLVTAELAGRLSSPVARAEESAEPSYGRKPSIEQIEHEDSIRRSSLNSAQHRKNSRSDLQSRSQQPADNNSLDPDLEEDTSHALHPPVITHAGGPISRLTEKKPPHNDDTTTAKEAPKYWGTEWAGRTAPDGTKVPQLAVCDFGYGASGAAAPHMLSSQNAPAQPLLEPTLD